MCKYSEWSYFGVSMGSAEDEIDDGEPKYAKLRPMRVEKYGLVHKKRTSTLSALFKWEGEWTYYFKDKLFVYEIQYLFESFIKRNYFPIQNLEKIFPNKSSVVTSPVISPR